MILRIFHLRIFVLVSLLGSCVSNGSAQNTDSLRKRFDEEAPRKWDEMRKLSQQLQGEANAYLFKVEEGKPTLVRHWCYQIGQDGSCKLGLARAVLTPNPKGTTLPRATVVNSKYAFTVTERKADSGWILGELDLFKKGKEGTIEFNDMNEIIDQTACALLRVNGKPLPKLIASKKLRVKKIHSRQGEKGEEIDLIFEYEKDDTLMGSFSGSITFDSANYWVVKGADLNVDIGSVNDRSIRVENTYTISPRGLPIPKLKVERAVSKGGNTSEGKWEYDLREQSAVQEHEFGSIPILGSCSCGVTS